MKLMAGKKLRQQAIQRTKLHIVSASRRGTELSRLLSNSNGESVTKEEYRLEEEHRLSIMEKGI